MAVLRRQFTATTMQEHVLCQFGTHYSPTASGPEKVYCLSRLPRGGQSPHVGTHSMTQHLCVDAIPVF